MTAPNAARGATPGQRFTDPDDSTWVMLARGLLAHDGPYWSYVGPTGFWSQRSQEEAEAAGLVLLVADPEVSDCENCGGQQCMDCALRHHHDECANDCPDCCATPTPAAAPAPLDPGNRETIRAERARAEGDAK
jgi:hypothetical protein